MKNFRIVLFLVALVALVFLVWTAPAEQTLGKVAKLVYLHGAISYMVFLILGLSALASLISLIGSNTARGWAKDFFKVALIFMAVNIGFAPIVTKMTWGVFFQWNEPRFIIAYFLFAFSIGIWLVASGLNNRWAGLMYAVPAPLAFVLLRIGQNLIHPESPVRSSGSMMIKGYFLGMAVVLLVLGLSLMDVLWKRNLEG